MQNKLSLLILCFLLTACANKSVFDASQVNTSLTPKSVVADPASNQGELALWGGMILSVENLKNTTQIELLAYPLASSHRPLQKEKPIGRFLVLHQGFLEPEVFVQGKLLSVLGRVSDIKPGKIGEASYSYPVITAQELHLWSLSADASETQFHFGIGIVF